MRLLAYVSGIIVCGFVILAIFDAHRPRPKVESKKVALLIMATGRYIEFVNALLDSADTYFCKRHDVQYYVFTDGRIAPRPNLTIVPQSQLGWPYDTLMRFAVYYNHKDLFKDRDYVFSCDADMLFADYVGSEMFGERVATIQPNYMFSAKPYERNPLSTACINRSEGGDYFAGGFYGATYDEFIKLTKIITDNICIDLARGFIAAINDESHLNRYFIDYKPDVVLSPSYCHFEHWRSPYPKKIIALVKTAQETNRVRKQAPFNPIDYYKKFVLET